MSYTKVGDNPVSYESSNEAVATIGSNGIIHVKHAGDVTFTVKLAENGNYLAASQTVTMKVVPKPVTATTVGVNRIYDGAKTVSMTATVDTGVNGETLSISGLTGTMADKNVGDDKTVTPDGTSATISAAGTDTANYTVSYLPGKVNITPKPADVVLVVSNKVYDGTTKATVLANVSPADLIPGDIVTFSGLAGVFDDAKIGAGKTVTVDSTNVVVSGKDAGNYEITVYPASASGSIVAYVPPAEPEPSTDDASSAQTPSASDTTQKSAASPVQKPTPTTAPDTDDGDESIPANLVLPKDSEGYSITSGKIISEDGKTLIKVFFTLEDGYQYGDDFAIMVNGVAVTLAPDGSFLIEDPQGALQIEVFGVEKIPTASSPKTEPKTKIVQARCLWHYFMIPVFLLFALCLFLQNRTKRSRGKKLFWGSAALAAEALILLVLALHGFCSLDWIFFGIALAASVILLFFISRDATDKTDDPQ